MALMAFAGAQRYRGVVTLDGGVSHPPGMQRHMLQHVHLGTLIESNLSHVVSEEQFDALKDDWSGVIRDLMAAGIIPVTDVQTNLDPNECDTIEAAAHAIESMDIDELKPAVPVLERARDLLADVIAGRRPSFTL
jgi:hypothetical protein